MRRWFASTSRLPRIDLKNLRVAEVQQNAQDRRVSDCNAARVVELYKLHLAKAQELETLLADRKKQHDVDLGRQIKDKIRVLTNELSAVDDALEEEASKIPNTTSGHTPIGQEDQAKEIARNDQNKKETGAVDHVDVLREHDWADFASAASACGEGFVYLKNDLAMLEIALVQWALMRARAAGWTVHLTPELVRDHVIAGCGFRPRDKAGAGSSIYSVAGEDVSLVGTAEISLAGMYADKLLSPGALELPIKLCGFSHAYRRETGQGGRGSRGLYRLHQFSKVELFALSHPNASEKLFDEMIGFQKGVLDALELPYRVLEMPSAELGLAAHRKIDCEVWMPSRGSYGEVSSASNCTDFQARRLNTRFRGDGGKNEFVHTLNATGLAVPRIIIGLIETHYDKQKKALILPKELREHMRVNELK